MSGFDHNRIGVFEGNFDPIHTGHVASVKAFMEQMKLDYLFVVPRYKGDGSDAQRVKMCELAFEDTDGVIVSDSELRGEGRVGLFEIVESLVTPATRVFVLLGSDELWDFDSSPRFDQLIRMCYPVYVRREQDPIIEKRIVEKLGEIYGKYGVMIRRILTEAVQISSSDIRKRIGAGEQISGLLPASVEGFIKENRLYSE